jgi:hypothetical protein
VANLEPTKEQRKESDLLSSFVQKVDDYLEVTESARQIAHKCRDYYDNYQWTPEELAALSKRKQAPFTDNRIKPKVQFLLGMENQGRTDPKGLPRTPDDEQSGEVSTDALRFVHDNNAADQKFTDGFQAMIVEGVEAHDVSVKFQGGKFEISHEQIAYDRIFWDPHSRRKDFADAEYLGMLEWMDFDEVLAMPGATQEAITIDRNSDTHNTFDDRPQFSHFIDKNRKRVRVFFINCKIRGVWHWSIFTKGAFIQHPIPSPYLDENGQPAPQFIFQAAFVDRDNNRYPEVASYLSIQDGINHRHSRALHLLNMRQTFGNKGAVPDPQKVKRELSKADGHIEIQTGVFGQDFGILPTNDMAQGNMELLEYSIRAIEGQGANATMDGKDQRTLSGVAFDKLQKGGLVEIGTLFDNHRHCKLRVWRAYFDRIKQYWTEERWIRVTDDNNAPKFSGLNRKVTMADRIMEQMGEIPAEMQGDPRLDMVIDIENPVNELDIDIIPEEAPDLGSMLAESFDMLMRMYEANPDGIPWDAVIEASNVRGKQALLNRMRGGTPAQQQAIAEEQQQKQAANEQLIQDSSRALIEKDLATAEERSAIAEQKRAETAKTLAEIEETQANTEKIDAETDQIEVETASQLDGIVR